jgi:hypothetical protein
MTPRRINEEAMARVLQSTPVMASLARQVVELYLDAVTADRMTRTTGDTIAKQLAAMKIWDQIVWKTELDKLPPRLQTVHIRKARVLLNDPAARWSYKTLDFGLRVIRVR